MIELKENRKYKIIIVGVGGTGSNLLSPLSRLIQFNNNHKLIIIDGDEYEAKNKKNQNISNRQIGRAKSEAMAELIQNKYPDVDVIYKDTYISQEKELLKILKGTEIPILVSCVDNNSTRKIFHNVFYDTKVNNIIYIDSGNGTNDRIGQVIIGFKQYGKIILNPVGDYFKEITEEEDTVEKATSCAATAHEMPQNIATNYMASAVLFNCLNNIISFNYIIHKSFFDCENGTVESYN
ncbi:thiF family protein [Clostridium argentinense CDC 2741]|uniref:ThiF family protein n=2 Tax=Clostridium argentinense TaxID=29341 RepID=A0A0C1UC62_9CLOT|nr:ThiF family adenylyltransferase [Clostridium argentinense]ARC83125.1 hypothetical protein RSJ17_00295 [Clostridium argentinense]KIE45140.1 thiF family protein [Clostridium argentinense CDC 2741]NFF41321.1 hypothetical protein [Clostridium argentinense]NFP51784.1 hypothetical protein [Clostridium argentinense]NFP74246.1 hypothetical protein [Clostridium argentinense]